MKVKHLLALVVVAMVFSGIFVYYFAQSQKEQLATSSFIHREKNKIVTQGPPKDPFKKPLGVSVSNDGGKIYVADSDNHRVRIFDKDWNLITQFGKVGTEKGQFGYPVAAVANNAGEIFVSEVFNNRVQVVSEQGHFIRWFPQNQKQLINPSILIIDPSDNVYVFDRGDQVIKVFSRNGELITKFGTGEGANDKLRFVMGMDFAADGSLLVSDSGHRLIKQFNVDGSFRELLTGVQGIPSMGLPRGLAVIDKNKFAVVDSLSRKVYLLEKKGKIWKNRTLEHTFGLPDGIYYQQGKLYVTDRSDDSIVVFENLS